MKKTRAFEEIEFRETDVPVCLIRKGLQPETCRVRVYDQMDDWLIGILLDEPGQNFGYHKGEKVGIFPGKGADGNTFYYSNMTLDKELTAEDLEDGTMLQQAIGAFRSEQTQDNFIEILALLRDSFVWIPCRAVLSERDQQMLEDLVKQDGEDLVGSTITSQDQIRLIPDILQSSDKLFFPVFTSPEEMGEYGQDFSKVQKHFLKAILLASDDEPKVEGIVVNAFTDNFILPADLFDVVQNAKSRLVGE